MPFDRCSGFAADRSPPADVFWRRSSPEVEVDHDSHSVDAVLASNVGLMPRVRPDARDPLLDLTADLISDKRWESAGDVELSTEVMVTIAANAALAVLGLHGGIYDKVEAIIVHPSTRMVDGLRSGPGGGTVSDHTMAVVGEAAWERGPVLISWDTALAESRSPGFGRNVVIHEFAHKIDMHDGYVDGIPPVRSGELQAWDDLLQCEFDEACESGGDHVLRPYAWTNPAEFFAVATEAFFTVPHVLHHGKPALYELLTTFYRQDPMQGFGPLD